MWPYVKDLLYRAKQLALAKGSSTGISVVWLGFCVLLLSFACTVFIEWLTGGRSRVSLRVALRSWKSLVGALSGLLIAWLILFVFSVLSVSYSDHEQLLVAQARKCSPVQREIQIPTKSPSTPRQGKAPKIHIEQKGNGNTANPGIIDAPINNGPCGVIQTGGSGNVANPTCNPPVNPNKAVTIWDPTGVRKTLLGTESTVLVPFAVPPVVTLADMEKKHDWRGMVDWGTEQGKAFPDFFLPDLAVGEGSMNLCRYSEATISLNKFIDETKDADAWQGLRSKAITIKAKGSPSCALRP